MWSTGCRNFVNIRFLFEWGILGELRALLKLCLALSQVRLAPTTFLEKFNLFFSLITLMALFAFDIWLLRFKSTKIQLLFKGKVKSLSCVRLFATPWTAAHQAPPSVGFFRQEYWNGLPFPSPGDLPDPGIKPRSPALQADALTSEPPTGVFDSC